MARRSSPVPTPPARGAPPSEPRPRPHLRLLPPAPGAEREELLDRVLEQVASRVLGLR
ncbi:hypothetical protein L6R53_06930 [Myxococcota bacterium]|nr:hypothetical protein [Myxococcota bacterium]